MNVNNPLINEFSTPHGVPPFHLIKSEHYVPAINEGIALHNTEIDAIVNNTETPDYKNTIEAFMYSGALLRKVTSVFYSQMGANTNDTLQKVAEEVSPLISAHFDGISMNQKLFDRIKIVHDGAGQLQLTREQIFLLQNMYKGFVNNGALLNNADKEKLKEINQKLSILTLKFDQNLLAETNNFKLVVDKKEDLIGLPESVIAGAAETAKQNGMDGKWMFTTQKPSMIPVLQYSQNRALREKLYVAYINRGNNNNEQDNKKLVDEVINLRIDKAKLLGYTNYAAYRLEERMAKSPDKAFELLNKLWEKSIVVANNEAEDLQDIINAEKGNFKLEAWDWMYYSEKLREKKYNLNENEIRDYLQLNNVRDGIFMVANKLYGITFKQITNVPLPHPDAQSFEVNEADGKLIGILYMDYHPRESKQGGAWCGSYREHEINNDTEILPVVTVVCNFTKASDNQPALLSMDETETLFHEFGHALDALFAKNTYPTTYIAWDFVELPSQIMEHWAFNPEVLKLYAKHYKTNAVMPDALITKISNSKYFNQGFTTVEYLAAALLDLKYHTLTENKAIDVMEFEKNYFGEIGLIPQITSRYRSTYFGHIMGGYDAGYYSYIWAGVLDNDAFDSFVEK